MLVRIVRTRLTRTFQTVVAFTVASIAPFASPGPKPQPSR
jgi:hypothetical protein